MAAVRQKSDRKIVFFFFFIFVSNHLGKLEVIGLEVNKALCQGFLLDVPRTQCILSITHFVTVYEASQSDFLIKLSVYVLQQLINFDTKLAEEPFRCYKL